MLWAYAPAAAVLHASSQGGDSNALAATSEPGFCGALWFLHIPKTGGDSVRLFLEAAALKAHRDASASAYKFVDATCTIGKIAISPKARWPRRSATPA